MTLYALGIVIDTILNVKTTKPKIKWKDTRNKLWTSNAEVLIRIFFMHSDNGGVLVSCRCVSRHLKIEHKTSMTIVCVNIKIDVSNNYIKE